MRVSALNTPMTQFDRAFRFSTQARSHRNAKGGRDARIDMGIGPGFEIHPDRLNPAGAFETVAAIQAGDAVADEIRRFERANNAKRP